MKVYANYEEKTGMLCDGSDTIDFTVESITLNPKPPYYFEVDCDLPQKLPDVLFVVVVFYQDGGSYYTTYGNGSVEGVFAGKVDARERANEIENGADSIHGHTPWKEYFGDLQCVKVIPVIFEHEEKDGK